MLVQMLLVSVSVLRDSVSVVQYVYFHILSVWLEVSGVYANTGLTLPVISSTNWCSETPEALLWESWGTHLQW